MRTSETRRRAVTRSSRRTSRREVRPDPAETLYRDAKDEARRLKQKHSSYYKANRRDFRLQVKKAHNRIFRAKPGPKADPRITRAARERVRGADWIELQARYIDGYGTMSEFTRGMAEDGFRRKVNSYLQRHPRLRRKSRNRTQANIRTKIQKRKFHNR